MDAYQVIRSLRSIHHFEDRPLPEEAVMRILQAGRWSGSAKNTQPWHFIVVQNRATLEALSACGSFASHLKGAALAVVIVTDPGRFGGFDSGRAAQNMMLAAWVDGIGSCIATLHEETCAHQVLGVPDEYGCHTAISFGYPLAQDPQTIEGQPRKSVLANLGRRPLSDLVHWDKW